MNHVNGSGYAETLTGPVNASDSNFARLRVRTATGDMMFRGCTSHQIEATSTYGSITYDNGRFQPGLARFESVHGNVALGVQGGAQIGAQTRSGHIVSSFRTEAQTRGNATTTQATVRGGGPVVTAITRNGSVYLYNGSVRAHPRVQAEMRGQSGYPAFGQPYPTQPRYAPARYGTPRYGTPRYAAPPQQQRYYGAPPGYTPAYPPVQRPVRQEPAGSQGVPPPPKHRRRPPG
jgi:hypothetical protein